MMSKVITAASYSLALASTVLAMGLSLALWHGQAEAYDPLGEFPLQVVDWVSVDHVSVTGTKCNSTSVDVDVEGEVAWQRMDPLGFQTRPSSGASVRVPGCTTSTFLNDIPDEVHAANFEGAVWRIQGIEWPVNPVTHERGVPRRWFTENFEIADGY